MQQDLPVDRLGSLRILVADDSPDTLHALEHFLAGQGHEVMTAEDGLAACERCIEARPDLVLMDIQLPGKDGFALLDEIRASPHRGLRVVALTAHAMSGDRERAIEAGFDGYITKPIDIRSFPELVRQALEAR